MLGLDGDGPCFGGVAALPSFAGEFAMSRECGTPENDNSWPELPCNRLKQHHVIGIIKEVFVAVLCWPWVWELYLNLANQKRHVFGH